jgi:hypothetical protein
MNPSNGNYQRQHKNINNELVSLIMLDYFVLPIQAKTHLETEREREEEPKTDEV